MSETSKSQFDLFGTRRFLPYFLTQFLGAFNDNLYKNALLIFIAYTASNPDIWINAAAGLFILPFFLFSWLAGQFAEKFEKSKLIKIIKLTEILIMGLGVFALLSGNITILVLILFLMGAQSAFFGPVKYSILPQSLQPDEIIGGNGLVESGTFLAILLGTIAGGIFIGFDQGPLYTSIAIMVFAAFGFVSSLFIPKSPATAPNLKINWNPVTETKSIFKIALEIPSVWNSIVGISWFWLLGAVYLAQMPVYTREYLGGNEQVVTLLLAIFSIGIGIGSALCEKLSGRLVELGLVPFGSIGITIFGVDLYLAHNTLWSGNLVGITEFLTMPGNWRVLFDLAMIGVFGGFYIVPLYAIIQTRSKPEHRSRIIAANNILNSIFMVASAVIAIVFLSAGMSIPGLFFTIAMLNILAAIYIYSLVPEFLMRFIVWIMISVMYRVQKSGFENIPDEGAGLVVCNHVSFTDALVLGGSCRRPLRFVMDYQIFKTPLIGFIFREAGAIPIAPKSTHPEIYEKAFEKISEYLDEGELVCIFPEGKLSRDGQMDNFKPGFLRILDKNPVPVIPMGLKGLWGSMFSYKTKNPFRKLPNRFRAKLYLNVGSPISPQKINTNNIEETVKNLSQ